MKLSQTVACAALIVPGALVFRVADAGAQTRPEYELGVDAAVAYRSAGDVDGGIVIGAPIDVRIGLIRPGPLTFEPRFTFNFDGTGNASSLAFTPTLNVLYQPDKRALVQRGLYFTAGLGLNFTRIAFDDDDLEDQSDVEPTINFGVGTRRSINQGAFRPEGFFAYAFDSETVLFGARLGVSFWK